MLLTAVCLICRLQQCWNLGCCFPRAGSCGLALPAVPALPSSSGWGSAGMVCISPQPCRKQKHAHPAGLYRCAFCCLLSVVCFSLLWSLCPALPRPAPPCPAPPCPALPCPALPHPALHYPPVDPLMLVVQAFTFWCCTSGKLTSSKGPCGMLPQHGWASTTCITLTLLTSLLLR